MSETGRLILDIVMLHGETSIAISVVAQQWNQVYLFDEFDFSLITDLVKDIRILP